VYEFMNASCVRRLADLLRADASLTGAERK
jgi:hypothetical protein